MLDRFTLRGIANTVATVFRAESSSFNFGRVARKALCMLGALSLGLCGCGRREGPVRAAAVAIPTVGVTSVTERPLLQQVTISSELVPFQQIDVYAKQAGYVKQLLVDYGSHVRQGQLMAVLEIPELEAQLQERKAAIAAQRDEVVRAEHEVGRMKAQRDVAHLQYDRLAGVAKSNPGMVAQQEVDNAQAKDLAAQSQLEAAQGAFRAAEGQLGVNQAQLTRTEALYSYSRITAPFEGVVTQRYANLGALMQAGTSSTQSTPLVRLSQESLYRLVIPVPETYVRYVRIGDPMEVRVPSLGRSFRGKVARFSVDVASSTRTMHTEVDVPNPNRQLVPGLYAEAVLTLKEKGNALAVPLQAVSRNGEQASVFVVDATNHVHEKTITTGTLTANYAEVLSGVTAGDQIVISDRSRLKPDQEVKPQATEAMVYEGTGRSGQ